MNERRIAGTGDGFAAYPDTEFPFEVYWALLPKRLPRLWMLAAAVAIAGLSFLTLQIVPFFPAGHSNPQVIREPNWDSAATRDLTMRACGDCHSYQTEWPWFSYVAPTSWVVSNHVWKARHGMNFNNWDVTSGKPRSPDQVEESIREGRMPPSAYLLTHPQARLTDAETEQLIAGLRRTMEADPHAAAMFASSEGGD